MKDDEDVVIASIIMKESSKTFPVKECPIIFATKRVKHLKSVALVAIEYWKSLKYVEKKMRDDEEVVLKAMEKDIVNLKYASDRIREKKNFVLRVIGKHLNSFQYLSVSMWDDKEVVVHFLKSY